jgi:cytidylate kinase
MPKDKTLSNLLASYYKQAQEQGLNTREINNNLSNVSNVADVRRLLRKLGDSYERTRKK